MECWLPLALLRHGKRHVSEHAIRWKRYEQGRTITLIERVLASGHGGGSTVHVQAVLTWTRRCCASFSRRYTTVHERCVWPSKVPFKVATTRVTMTDKTISCGPGPHGIGSSREAWCTRRMLECGLTSPYALNGSTATHAWNGGARVRVARVRLERKGRGRGANAPDSWRGGAGGHRAIERVRRSIEWIRHSTSRIHGHGGDILAVRVRRILVRHGGPTAVVPNTDTRVRGRVPR